MTDAEYKRLTDALTRQADFDYQGDKADIEAVYDAARKYAALLPRLKKLVEAQNELAQAKIRRDNSDGMTARIADDEYHSLRVNFAQTTAVIITQIAEIIKGAGE